MKRGTNNKIRIIMKTILNVIVVLVYTGTTLAQSSSNMSSLDNKYLDKVRSIDMTVSALYEVISGEKGDERNWELFKYLFYPRANMVASGINREGQIGARYISSEEYIEMSGEILVENGFIENELNRVTEQFGSMAHVFSTYESFHSKMEAKPFMRGINSIQLLYDGNRWWIINIYWSQESQSNPIPQKYQGKGT